MTPRRTLQSMSATEENFTMCWAADAPRVMAFARRHVGHDEALDVVADTFLAAWRRWDDVPDPAIPWLLVTARRVIQGRDRSARRRRALTERVALLEGVAAPAEDTSDAAFQRRDALQRLATLDEQHREALLLVAWDGLSTEQAAAVLGIRPAALRRRVSRARAALDRLVDGVAPTPTPTHLTSSLRPVKDSS